jgi:hypothetical protein
MKKLLAAPMKKSTAIILASLFLVAGLFIGARTALNNAILTSDMDADGHKILNLPIDQPLPPPVFGASIPPTWLGTTSSTAAQGNLAEYLSHKGAASGYASLDSGGKVPSAQIPAGVGTGSVTNVSITTANGVSGTVTNPTTTPAISLSLGAISPSSTSITATNGSGFIALASQSVDATAPAVGGAKIWLDDSGRLKFGSSGTLWVGLATGLFTSAHVAAFPDKNGTFAYTDDVPTAMVGVGTGHKGGTVPDTGSSGDPTNYLARDGTWKTTGTFTAPSYQPVAPTPLIFPSTNTTGARNLTFGPNGVAGSAIFYSLSATSDFHSYSGASASLPAGATMYVYQAVLGWTNSAMASYTNPNP